MYDGICSECGAPFEIKGMRTKTCSPECSIARGGRHPYRVVSKPTNCSECSSTITSHRVSGKRVTCSAACATARSSRIKKEKWAASRPAPKPRTCRDCPRDISERRSHAIRCSDCQNRHLKVVNNQKAKDRWAALQADEKARRKWGTRLKSMYGITLEEYEAKKLNQSGLCAVCGLPPKGRGRQDTLVVDHDHMTGKARDLLCGNCNSGLGLFAENPEILIRAAEYAARWSALQSVPRS